MNKTLVIALLIVLVVPIAVETSLVPVKAEVNIPTILKVYASPNPVGVGQAEFISLFFTKPIPTTNNQRYGNLTVNVVKPDGTNETFGPYIADSTGGVGGIEFVPKETGNYTVQAFFSGQKLVSGDYVLAAQSEPIHFTAQEESIPGFPLHPLPTEYWSRPIYATNYEWAQLGGSWWGLYKPGFTDTGGYDATGNNFNAYSKAPNSAHIMWVKRAAFGGQPGNPISGDQESQFTSTSILYRQFEPVIINGIIYYKVYPNVPTTTSSPFSAGLAAIDIRTGRQLWQVDTNEIIVFGWLMQFHTIQEYGTQAFLVTAYNSSTWRLRDPMTGYVIANITNVPSTTAAGLVDTDDDNAQGAVLIHSISRGNLTLWNSTHALCNYASFGGMTIRPSGDINYTRGEMWSIPVVDKLNGNTISLSIAGRTNKYVLLRQAPSLATQSGAGYAIEAGYDAMSGKLLWGPVNRTFPLYHDVSVLATGEEWYVEHDKDTNQAYVFSLATGTQIGQVIQLPGNALAALERGGAIAYGKCYVWDFGGYINAIYLENGTLAWTYEARNANYDTPYGIYPLWHFGTHSIADGKLFLSESRMYDPPLFPNAHKQAINVTDGSRVWSVLGFFGREPSAIADGYMVGYNSYDAQIYSFGKGPTAISLSASPKASVYGGSVVIEGSITDESPGTKDDDRTARFPDGVPVVSDESQEAWMEYVYMQQPKPANITGVPVKLSVLDSNGNYRAIGSATSDKDGFYTFRWIPDIEGQFTVYAQYEGSESYWPSHAVTSFVVDPSPSIPAATQAAQPLSVSDQYFLPAVAAIIITIIAVGAVLLIAQRKRP